MNKSNKKIAGILCLSILAGVVSKPTIAQAWSPRTHYYSSLTYTMPNQGNASIWTAQGSGFADFGYFSLDSRTGLRSDGAEMTNLVTDDVIGSLVDGGLNALHYIVGMKSHYTQDTKSSAKRLDVLRTKLGLPAYYPPNNNGILESIAYMDIKAYLDTYISRYKMSNNDEMNYDNTRYTIPLFVVQKAYKSKGHTVASHEIIQGLVQSHFAADVYNNRFLFYKYSDAEKKMLDDFLNNDIKNASVSSATPSELEYMNMTKEQLKKELSVDEDSNYARSIAEEKKSEQELKLIDYMKKQVDTLVKEKVISYTSTENKDVKGFYDIDIKVNKSDAYKKALEDTYAFKEELMNTAFELEDVNKDGQINETDLRTVSSYYNTFVTNESKHLDLNKDGYIDISDLVMISKKMYNISNDITHWDDINKIIESDFRTPLTRVKNTKYETSIVGKGSTGQEEGKSTILVRNIEDNSYRNITLSTEKNQTALKVCGGKGDTIYVIAGGSHGTLNYGGDMYAIDLNKMSVLKINTANDNEQIVSAKFIDDITMELTKYKFDDQYIDYVKVTEEIYVY